MNQVAALYIDEMPAGGLPRAPGVWTPEHQCVGVPGGGRGGTLETPATTSEPVGTIWTPITDDWSAS